MRPPPLLDALIVGGGPVGLFLGCLLARRGLLSPAADSPRRAQLLARLAQAHPELHSALRPIAHELGYPELPQPDQTPGFCVRVALLGRVSVTRSHEGRPREWGRARARDLLALLAVHDGGLAREAAQEALRAGTPLVATARSASPLTRL